MPAPILTPIFTPRSALVDETTTDPSTSDGRKLVKRVHIIGGKNHGKTTLVVELVQALAGDGLRVGTIKHTHHEHELDTPGKDSFRHREAGSAAVGIYSPSMNAVFWPPVGTGGEPDDEAKYAAFAPMYAHCDLVLVEGDSRTTSPKIEVWRSVVGTQPLACADRSIAAVITDDKPSMQLAAPIWPRSDLESIIAALHEL